MHTTHLRDMGGSVMLTVPPDLLDLLQLRVGNAVDVGVENGRLVVQRKERPSYTLDQLLAQCTEMDWPSDEDRTWVSDKPVGRRAPLVKRGDIWLVTLDPTAGHEQQGRRPVVIVSPAAFNEVTKTPVALPITTGGSFARRRGFAVPLETAGMRTTGVIRCDQPRAIDLRARKGKHLETVPESIMDDVPARLKTILE